MPGGIQLNPSASGSGDCCCGGGDGVASSCCTPCNVPKTNIKLSSNLGDLCELVLGYKGSPGWSMDGLPWGTHPGSTYSYARVDCIILGSTPLITLTIGDSYGTTLYCESYPYPFGLILADYSCSPFHIHYTVNPALCTYWAGLGYTDFYLDGDEQDPATCCRISFYVTGCPDSDGNPQYLDSANISVWTDSSKSHLIASGKSSDSFDVIVAGSYYREISMHGFVTDAATKSYTCFSQENVTLVPASGSTCTSSCVNPIADVLHATHSVFGPFTLTRNTGGAQGDGWYATITYSYPGCFCCPARTVTVSAFLDVNGQYSEKWSSD